MRTMSQATNQPTRWNVAPSQQHQDGETDPPAPPPAPPAGGLTQAQVDAIVGKEKATTEAATKKAIADSLGVDLDQAAAIIKDAQAKAEGEKTEAQKARDAADAEAKKSAEATAAALASKHELDVIRALARAGVPIVADKPENQDAVDKKLVTMSKLVEAEPGADGAAIATAVTALKETMPELFVGAASGPPAKTPVKTPSTDPKIPAGKPAELNEDAMKKGAERAQRTTTRPSGYAWENPPQPAATT